MPFGSPSVWTPKPLEAAKSAWADDWNTPTPTKPSWSEDEGLKKKFGCEIAKGYPSPFAAANVVFPEDTSSALWVSINWINDPVVLAARDLYLKTAQLDVPLLDKTQLASKLLLIADEKLPTGKHALAVEDRLGSLKLYAQLMGFLDTKNNPNVGLTQINQIIVKLVKTEKKSEEHAKDNSAPVIEAVTNPVPVKLKLVS